jgi:hypothetical protein
VAERVLVDGTVAGFNAALAGGGRMDTPLSERQPAEDLNQADDAVAGLDAALAGGGRTDRPLSERQPAEDLDPMDGDLADDIVLAAMTEEERARQEAGNSAPVSIFPPHLLRRLAMTQSPQGRCQCVSYHDVTPPPIGIGKGEENALVGQASS